MGFDPNQSRRGSANKPINITFLEVIMEFSPKLIRQDKAAVKFLAKINPVCSMRYLERHGPPILPSKEPIWEPYLLYRNSLVEKHPDDASSVRSFSTAYTARGRGRGRGRGRSTPTPSER
ncbi:hypothetical protein OSTOST_18534 [Ostertagia ostertagi]